MSDTQKDAPESVSDEALDKAAGGGFMDTVKQSHHLVNKGKPGDGSVKPVDTQFMGFGEGSGV